MGRWDAAIKSVSIIIGVALTWVAAFSLNEWVFAPERHSLRANWIFLPAAVRLIAVLLFEEVGALGLALGAFVVVSAGSAENWLYDGGLALSSGIAPLAALIASRRFIIIQPDLAELKPRHVLVLALSGAVANAAILNAYLAAVGRFHGDVEQIVTVLIGDCVGIAAVLIVLSTFLAFALPRRR